MCPQRLISARRRAHSASGKTEVVKHVCPRTNSHAAKCTQPNTIRCSCDFLHPFLCFPNLLKFEKKILNNQRKMIIIRKNVLKAFEEQLGAGQVMDGVN